ncbi:hypothetical protein BDP81DRAFT_207059 [Colletotrichum phormii]|uniref:Uncharacterized protein n=1 Tax=Colletotrichum phormii TaxID=359342 RepID=A0AAI9ZWQ9_9PEZI|nr:uncharacterized protein BDP81DRAFT_207059 [Colletotrichum phormii]KAK1638373.1 hypothetical protein BDP81DRAFT_207059 [Colletotrichum phormii]
MDLQTPRHATNPHHHASPPSIPRLPPHVLTCESPPPYTNNPSFSCLAQGQFKLN